MKAAEELERRQAIETTAKQEFDQRCELEEEMVGLRAKLPISEIRFWWLLTY